MACAISVDAETYLLTSASVVASAAPSGLLVRLPCGTACEAKLVGSVPEVDVALLALPDGLERPPPPLQFADSGELAESDFVIAVGGPSTPNGGALLGLVRGRATMPSLAPPAADDGASPVRTPPPGTVEAAIAEAEAEAEAAAAARGEQPFLVSSTATSVGFLRGSPLLTPDAEVRAPLSSQGPTGSQGRAGSPGSRREPGTHWTRWEPGSRWVAVRASPCWVSLQPTRRRIALPPCSSLASTRLLSPSLPSTPEAGSSSGGGTRIYTVTPERLRRAVDAILSRAALGELVSGARVVLLNDDINKRERVQAVLSAAGLSESAANLAMYQVHRTGLTPCPNPLYMGSHSATTPCIWAHTVPSPPVPGAPDGAWRHRLL